MATNAEVADSNCVCVCASVYCVGVRKICCQASVCEYLVLECMRGNIIHHQGKKRTFFSLYSVSYPLPLPSVCMYCCADIHECERGGQEKRALSF